MAPLPVAASPDDAEAIAPEESFVSDRAVRQLLVGPLSVEGERNQQIIEDGFIGRPQGDSPFVSFARSEEKTDAPAKSFEPSGPHPALTERRAAPPAPRQGPESGFGRREGSDRRWVLSMGVGAATLILCGAFFGFSPFSSEAAPPNVEVAPAPEASASVEPSGYEDDSLAFTGDDSSMP